MCNKSVWPIFNWTIVGRQVTKVKKLWQAKVAFKSIMIDCCYGILILNNVLPLLYFLFQFQLCQAHLFCFHKYLKSNSPGTKKKRKCLKFKIRLKREIMVVVADKSRFEFKSIVEVNATDRVSILKFFVHQRYNDRLSHICPSIMCLKWIFSTFIVPLCLIEDLRHVK